MITTPGEPGSGTPPEQDLSAPAEPPEDGALEDRPEAVDSTVENVTVEEDPASGSDDVESAVESNVDSEAAAGDAGEIDESLESLWESAPTEEIAEEVTEQAVEEPAEESVEEPVAAEPAEPGDARESTEDSTLAEPGEPAKASEVSEEESAAPEEPADVAVAEPGQKDAEDTGSEGEASEDNGGEDESKDREADPAWSAASDLPDLTTDRALYSALEALLLVVDEPADEEQLAAALFQPAERVTEALRTMAILYTEDGRGIDLRRVGEGWRFYTRDRYAPFVEKLILGGQRAKLTRAALESLAVIAYRQPVTRARVAAVRGVNVDGVVRTLLARGLIEEVGTDSDTGGILYRTTELFLERLGLSSLEDLPPIAPLLPEVDAVEDI